MPGTLLADQITGPRISRKNRTAEFDYVVLDAEDAEDAEDLVLASAPATYRTWPIDDVVTGPMGPDHYKVTVKYGITGGGLRPQTGDIQESWTTGGGTAKIKTSLETIESSTDAPNQNRAINVVDGKIEGIEVIEPAWAETITRYIATADITAAKAKAFAATGTVNDDNWRGFAKGEAMLIEVVGHKRSEGDWEVSYRFGCRANRTNYEIADGAFVIDSLEGWHLPWVLYRETVEDGQTRMRAEHYYVERLYDYSDFDDLDLD